jgi:dTDP-4-amino-4,6-dideoxygalactose transaminase
MNSNPIRIPFNRPHMVGKELWYIAQAHAAGQLAGDGPFTKKCRTWLEQRTGAKIALLTHSCTSALDMAAILAGVGPGDEIIMPSFTFVSTANAFVLRGATPVFVDIRPDTLNLDETKLKAAITKRTKAIVPVHYAGVACEMAEIMDIAERNNLMVIEDAAQGLMARYRGRALGSFGHMATLSFHETKNVISGEGGALLVNDPNLLERAEIVREKGTNRTQFFRGQVDKYTWIDIGSSFLPGELIAAFLWAQLEEAPRITTQRTLLWERYQQAFEDLEAREKLVRPYIPADREHNGHMYYVLLPNLGARTEFIEQMKANGVQTVFHYVPLHNSPAGRKFGRAVGDLAHTVEVADRLVRLPLWPDLGQQQEEVIEAVVKSCELAEKTPIVASR